MRSIQLKRCKQSPVQWLNAHLMVHSNFHGMIHCRFTRRRAKRTVISGMPNLMLYPVNHDCKCHTHKTFTQNNHTAIKR